jgi:hypothetical protein
MLTLNTEDENYRNKEGATIPDINKFLFCKTAMFLHGWIDMRNRIRVLKKLMA